MRLKRFVGLGLACILTLSAAACGGTNNTNSEEQAQGNQNVEAEQGEETGEKVPETPTGGTSTEKTDETLVVALASEPATLWANGSGKTDNNGLIVENCILDRLVIYDSESNEVLPNLATEWEWVDDKHIQFTLRDDVVMADGTPLEAEDVVYTVKTAAEYSANIDVGRYFDAATTEAMDAHTVVIGMTTVAPDFLSMLAQSSFGIVSEGAVQAAGGIEAAVFNPVIGVGKYIFKEWQQGQYILLERNEEYWDDSYMGYYKEIKFTFTNDAAAREMAVESGDADIAYEIPANIAASFENSDAVQTVFYTAGQVQHLFFNIRDEGPCQDAKVREAISNLIDLEALNMVATGGYGEISNGWFTPDSTYYYDVWSGADRSVNVERAKELLAEAGYENGLTLKTISRQNMTAAYTVIQENLRQAGIELEINNVDTAQFVEGAKKGEFDIILVGSNVETRQPTLFTFYQASNCETVIGGTKMTTDTIDANITKMIETSDVEEAKALAKDIAMEIHENYFSIDTYVEYVSCIMNNDLKGFHTIERGYIDCTSFYK